MVNFVIGTCVVILTIIICRHLFALNNDKMASKEKPGDVGAPETASQIWTTSIPKHCRICQVAVKSRVGSHGEGKCLSWRLHEVTLRVENLECESKSLKVAHSKELDELSSLHEKRVRVLLVTISSRRAYHCP